MPEGSLIDILWLTDRVLHYTRHFGTLSGLEPEAGRSAAELLPDLVLHGLGLGRRPGRQAYARSDHGVRSVAPESAPNRLLKVISGIRQRVFAGAVVKKATELFDLELPRETVDHTSRYTQKVFKEGAQ